MCKGLTLCRHDDVGWEFSNFEQASQLWTFCGMYFQGDIIAADSLPEKVEPAPLKPRAPSANAPQPDPTLPVSPNNELSENSGIRLNDGVQATLAGSRAPGMTLPNQTTTGSFNELSGDNNANDDSAPISSQFGLPNTQRSTAPDADTTRPHTKQFGTCNKYHRDPHHKPVKRLRPVRQA